jgi:hypothetical protein
MRWGDGFWGKADTSFGHGTFQLTALGRL